MDQKNLSFDESFMFDSDCEEEPEIFTDQNKMERQNVKTKSRSANFGKSSDTRQDTEISYRLYCNMCDKVKQKISGVPLTHCNDCNNFFIFECIKCHRRYVDLINFKFHLQRHLCSKPRGVFNINNNYINKNKRTQFGKKENEIQNSSRNFYVCPECEQQKNKDVNKNESGKEKKLFRCYICPFECDSKISFKYHLHGFSETLETPSEPKAEKISQAPIDSRTINQEVFPKDVDLKRFIKAYCTKCDTSVYVNNIDEKIDCYHCKIPLLNQCKICRRRYSNINNAYVHLKSECLKKVYFKRSNRYESQTNKTCSLCHKFSRMEI